MRPLESVPDPLLMPSENGAEQERIAYFIQPLGGPSGVAKLYLEAGLLIDTWKSQYIPDSSKDGNTTAWKRDREATRRYFDLPECFVRPSKFLFSL
ncbi:hypothetical protein BGY98DRAFT_1182950 [Russula aff. rugulosa BPL654]|nr:hypothetical protein BGY98DRAFT_1182950 [Russula aff. rugulosa BPL654]